MPIPGRPDVLLPTEFSAWMKANGRPFTGPAYAQAYWDYRARKGAPVPGAPVTNTTPAVPAPTATAVPAAQDADPRVAANLAQTRGVPGSYNDERRTGANMTLRELINAGLVEGGSLGEERSASGVTDAAGADIPNIVYKIVMGADGRAYRQAFLDVASSQNARGFLESSQTNQRQYDEKSGLDRTRNDALFRLGSGQQSSLGAEKDTIAGYGSDLAGVRSAIAESQSNIPAIPQPVASAIAKVATPPQNTVKKKPMSQPAWLAYHKKAGSKPTGTYAQYVTKHPPKAVAPLLPGGWGRAPDVKGPFGSVPQVDIGSFEVGQNTGGKFFIRPRTDVTGLDPSYQALFRAFDAQTGAQAAQIQGAYTDFRGRAVEDANALTARLGSLGELAGRAFTPTTNNPTAGIEADIAATGQRQQVRDAALQVNTASMLPSIADRAGLDSVATYKGGRASDRFKALFDARAAQASIDAATGKLGFEGEQAQLDRASKAAIAGRSAAAAAAAQAAQDRRAALDRASRERIAAQNRAASGGGGSGGAGGTPQALGAAANAARSAWNGTPDKTAPIGSVDAQGKPITTIPGTGKVGERTKGIRGVGPVFNDLLGRGLTPQQAEKITAAIVGKVLYGQFVAWHRRRGTLPGG